METYAQKYAALIVKDMLRLERGEKLSINCTEDTIEFAHMLAHTATEETGLPVSLVFIENGKVESVDEIDPEDMQKIQPKGFAMVHLATFRNPIRKEGSELDAPLLQDFALLAEPVDLERRIAVPWATVYVPTPAWAEFMFGPGATTDQVWLLLSDLLQLDSDDASSLYSMQRKILEMRMEKLEKLHITALELESENTHLFLPLVKDAVFGTSAGRLASGRVFYPILPCEDIFIPLDMNGAKGEAVITHPFRLFDRIIDEASFHIENGEVTGCMVRNGEKYFQDYLNIDKESRKVGELVICDEMTRASRIEQTFGIPLLDRMRSTHLCLGATNGACLRQKDLETAVAMGANTGFARLELPIGNDEMDIYAITAEGEKVKIVEDGLFLE